MTSLILDTSVIVKWFSQDKEDDVEIALNLRYKYLDKGIYLIEPDLLWYELANVLRYKPSFSINKIKDALKSLELMGIDILPYSNDIGKDAVKIAFDFDITVYDSYFIALAERLKFKFITADRKIFSKIKDRPNVTFLRDLII